jgi:uncharacterized protein (DUF169 family)
MNLLMKDRFTGLWKKYFGEAELPVILYYSDGDGGAEKAEKPKGRSCLICELAKVRNGKSLCYNAEAIACSGAKRYLGYTKTMRPGFEYFLSCGNETIEGERYIQTPEMVGEFMKIQKDLAKTGKNIIFKRWDRIEVQDQPEVVVFFAKPDVLSGLFTWANFDQTDPNGTFTPFGAGCGTIVHYPYLEIQSKNPRAVIGMFDPSARPCVPENVLTFAVPMVRFEKMIGTMEETFLITPTWNTVMNRINRS